MPMREIAVKTVAHKELVDVTALVRKALADMDARDGIALVQSPHTTAGVIVNENADPDVRRDLLSDFRRVAPPSPGHLHAEGNSDAHFQTSLAGTSVSLVVSEGTLMLGTWQAVYFAEFDGPRSRRLWVAFTGRCAAEPRSESRKV